MDPTPDVPTPERTPPAQAPSSSDPFADLKALIRRTRALPAMAMRRSVCREYLEAADPRDAAFVLDQLVRRAVTGDQDASVCLLAAVAWLLAREARAIREPDEASYRMLQRIYTAATEENRATVSVMLLDLPPHRTAKIRRQGTPRGKVLTGRDGRELSLGERKQIARTSNRAALDALILDPDPQVVRKVCANPAVRERDILTIATRRPNPPEILRELLLHDRWLVQYTIRHAITLNPYAPTSLGLKLLPFLHGTDLRNISRAGDVHPVISETAGRLIALRSMQRLAP